MMRISFLVFVAFVIFSCRQMDREAVLIEGEPTEMAEDVVMEFLDSSRLRVRLSAPLMIRQELGGSWVQIFDKGIFVEFCNTKVRTGRYRVESYLTAQRALQDIETKKVVVQDDVMMYNIYGDTLYTTELIWDEKKGEVYTSKFVMIKRPDDERIYSYGFRANQNFTTFEVNAFEGDIKIRDLTVE